MQQDDATTAPNPTTSPLRDHNNALIALLAGPQNNAGPYVNLQINPGPPLAAESECSPDSRAKHWCFTINNPTDGDVGCFEGAQVHAQYYCYGYEVGAQGTPHLQSYICFRKQMRFSVVRALFPRASFRVARGTPEQNRVYCSKDGLFVEWGECPVSRHIAGNKANKEKWARVRDLAVSQQLDVIAEEYPAVYIQSYRTIKQIGFDKRRTPPPLPSVCGIWYWGKSGVGKSHAARANYPNAYIKMANKWWDNYEGEENVILDDLDKGHECLGHHLKIWADKYPFRSEVKNFTMMMRPKWFVVTSQYHPTEIWSDPETLEAIIRRFTISEFLKLDDRDLTKAPQKRKRTKTAPLKKKPPLYRQNASGCILPNTITENNIENYGGFTTDSIQINETTSNTEIEISEDCSKSQ